MATRTNLLSRLLGWLRAGYPAGVPEQDYVALLGILDRRLTETEVTEISDELAAHREAGSTITGADIRRIIESHVHERARPEDIMRVSSRLAAGGWPLAFGDDTDEEPGSDTFLGRIVHWLREGYPGGIPVPDYVPLLAVLQRRLTKAEVKQVSKALRRSQTAPATVADVEGAIARHTHEEPADADVERVLKQLRKKGFPLDV